MSEKEVVHIRVVDKDGNVHYKFDVTEEDLEEIKENNPNIRLVKDNVYEIEEDEEGLEELKEEIEEIEEIKEIKEILQELKEDEVKKKENKKWSKKKKVTVFGVLFILFVVFPIIEGYQNSKLIDDGKPMEAEIIGKHVEKEKIIFTHPTLELFVDGKYDKVWVKSETYDSADFGNKVRVVKSKDGTITLDPRYQYEELIVK